MMPTSRPHRERGSTRRGDLRRRLLIATLFLAAPAAAPAAASAQDGPGGFQHHPRTDDAGEDRSLVATRSSDGLLILGWQCTATGMRTLVALGWRWVGNENHDILVAYRFPSGEPSVETLWRLADPGTVAWMRIGDIAPFTDAALDADSVHMTLSDPFDGESIEAVFGLDGLDDALALLGCEMRRPPAPVRYSSSTRQRSPMDTGSRTSRRRAPAAL